MGKKVFLVLNVICVFSIIMSIVLLRSNTYFDKLSLYGEPVCVADKHKFKSDKCDECGNDIMENGIFVKKFVEDYMNAINMEKHGSAKFSDYYSNYKRFSEDYNKAFSYAVLLIISVLCLITVNIISFRAKSKLKEVSKA